MCKTKRKKKCKMNRKFDFVVLTFSFKVQTLLCSFKNVVQCKEIFSLMKVFIAA
jgi:hypothetical protein